METIFARLNRTNKRHPLERQVTRGYLYNSSTVERLIFPLIGQFLVLIFLETTRILSNLSNF